MKTNLVLMNWFHETFTKKCCVQSVEITESQYGNYYGNLLSHFHIVEKTEIYWRSFCKQNFCEFFVKLVVVLRYLVKMVFGNPFFGNLAQICAKKLVTSKILRIQVLTIMENEENYSSSKLVNIQKDILPDWRTFW